MSEMPKDEKPKLENFECEYSCDDCEKAWVESHSGAYTKESVDAVLEHINKLCLAIGRLQDTNTNPKAYEFWDELITYVERNRK